MGATVQWLGHSTCLVTTASGTKLLIDPWLNDNPGSKLKVADIKELDAILITHDHWDHVGNAIEVANLTGTKLIAHPETCESLVAQGLESKLASRLNTGSGVKVKDVGLTSTHAFHTARTGQPGGFILHMADGKNLWHTGDTGIFGDMKLFGELYGIHTVLLPIGGLFTMDPFQAAHACRLIGARYALPLHYRTFPVLEQSADKFAELTAKIAPDTSVVRVDWSDVWEVPN